MDSSDDPVSRQNLTQLLIMYKKGLTLVSSISKKHISFEFWIPSGLWKVISQLMPLNSKLITGTRAVVTKNMLFTSGWVRRTLVTRLRNFTERFFMPSSPDSIEKNKYCVWTFNLWKIFQKVMSAKGCIHRFYYASLQQIVKFYEFI